MKLTTVWGILPVISLKSKDSWGHAKGPLIWLPENHTKALYRHELFHVKQWYAESAVFLAGSALVYTAAKLAADSFPALVANVWAITILVALVVGICFSKWTNSKRQHFRRETAAYGESLRNMPSTYVNAQAMHYARTLATSDRYGLNVSTDEALQRIKDRFEDGRLF